MGVWRKQFCFAYYIEAILHFQWRKTLSAQACISGNNYFFSLFCLSLSIWLKAMYRQKYIPIWVCTCLHSYACRDWVEILLFAYGYLEEARSRLAWSPTNSYLFMYSFNTNNSLLKINYDLLRKWSNRYLSIPVALEHLSYAFCVRSKIFLGGLLQTFTWANSRQTVVCLGKRFRMEQTN